MSKGNRPIGVEVMAIAGGAQYGLCFDILHVMIKMSRLQMIVGSSHNGKHGKHRRCHEFGN